MGVTGQVLLQLIPASRASLVAAHVTDFASPAAVWRWRRSARRDLRAVDGLVFARSLLWIGTRRSNGFGAGVPHVAGHVLVGAWRSPDAFAAFAAGPLGSQLAPAERRWSWAAFDVTSTRGSHLGHRPLQRAAHPSPDGRFAALTLGRCSWRRLRSFIREGRRLEPFVHAADGLLAAVSAGNPLTGNLTLSVWESEAQMVEFAYGDGHGHRRAVRATPPILREQLNARLALRQAAGEWAERVARG